MLAAVVVGAAATDAPTLAQTGQEHWAPFSTTAMSITGDIALSPKELRAAGHAFPVELAAELPQYDSLAGKVPARVLKVTQLSDPPLLGGNRLGCGTPIRWIVVFRFDNGAKLGLDVFDGPDLPRSEKDPTLCAIFTYARP
jgi:hypothetical protein